MTLAIIDLNGTLYDPDTNALMAGAKELLGGLKRKGVTLVLVSKQVFGREGLPKQLGIADYFSEIAFVQEKTGEHFREIMDRHGATPAQTYVIGDYPRSEIRAGNEAGAFTIHFIGGRYPSMDYESDFDKPNAPVEKLEDAIPFIK